MGKEISSARVFLAIVLLTGLGFLSWLVVLFVLWLVLHTQGLSTQFWPMTEALSTALAAAGVLGAGYVAHRELSEISNGRYIEVADRLFDELNSVENIKARRWIYENLPSDPEKGMSVLSEEGQAAIKQVLNSLDRVAFLTQGSWIPDDIIMPWMHPMIAKCWEKLGPYVNWERVRRNEPYYYRYAGELAIRCRTWREKNSVDAKTEWIERAL